MPLILRNPKVHYRVYDSPPYFNILSQTDPVNIFPSYVRPILVLHTHLRLGLPSD